MILWLKYFLSATIRAFLPDVGIADIFYKRPHRLAWPRTRRSQRWNSGSNPDEVIGIKMSRS